MEVRINRKKFNCYAFDIETHNDEESIQKRETSMWLGSFIDENSKIDDETSYVYNMDEVLTKLEELSTPKRKHGETKKPCKNICVWVYNLSFEYSFLLPYLFKWGFKYASVINNDDEFVFNSVTTHSVSSVWNITLKFHKNSGIVLFRDLAKIYGGGLREVAKAFGLPTQKGDLDYRLNRLHNHIVSTAEKHYCFNDTRILIDILLIMKERNDRFFFNSMSMASYSMKQMIKYGWSRDPKPYQKYREMYPELDEKETNFLRNAVSGGITYAPERYQYKDIQHDIIAIDKNSMHPSSAYFNKFAYGKGEYFKGKPTNYADYSNCCHIRISFYGVKLHSVIELIGFKYVDDFELTVWDFEIETMKKCYENLEIEYIDYYRYKKKPLVWKKYYAHCRYSLIQAKERKDAFNTLYYKLLMNSSYGKSLERAHVEVYENIINDDGIITSKTLSKEKPEFLSDEQWNLKLLNAKYTSLPYGSQIPAYSRCDLIETALRISPDGSKIVYFDTDSIFFIDDEETRENVRKYIRFGEFLGEWKVDKIIKRMQVTAPKRYKYENQKGETKIKAGGINFTEYLEEKARERGLTDLEDIKDFVSKYHFDFDEINIVSSNWLVRRAFRVKGGTIIDLQRKEMSVPKKYIEIFKNNL